MSNIATNESSCEVTVSELDGAEKGWNEIAKSAPVESSYPILPVAGEKNVLITSALPYVNNVPHLGNIIGCVLSADVFARYCRLRGWNTLYVCGTDEYGTATETKALEEGITPKAICDKYFRIHDETYKWFGVAFDFFGRTTSEEQKRITRELFLKVHENGFTSKAAMEQLKCENCDKFLADRFVEGTCPKCKYVDARGDQCDGCGHLINAIELIEPRCKICKCQPHVRTSDQLFLELPKIEDKLREWIEKSSPGWSANAKSITNTWLKDGLKARCITRDLKWGIPVPLDEFKEKVFYVWFDAPIGYISMTAQYTPEWRKWWQKQEGVDVTYFQFMAKDNVPFHSVMFPSTLLSLGESYNLVDHIMATEYLNYEDGKFSKSRGIGVFGTDARETGLSADVFRFYLCYVRPESQDTSFSWQDLATKHNSELLNNLGNFVNRSLMFAEKFFHSTVPEMHLGKEELQLLALVNRELTGYHSTLEQGKLKDGIRNILSVSRLGNQYIQSGKPWQLIKKLDEEERMQAGTIVGVSCNLVCLLITMLHPYMPETASIMMKQVNISHLYALGDRITMMLSPGHKIGKPWPLFAKIEDLAVKTLKKKFAGKQNTSQTNGVAKCDVKTLKTEVEMQEMLSAKIKECLEVDDKLKTRLIELEELKSQLERVEQQAPSPLASVDEIACMEEKVATQADLVRKMKSEGLDKSVWQSELNTLLQLKSFLAEMKGEPKDSKKNRKKNK